MDYYKRWFLQDLLTITDIVAIPMFSDQWSAGDKAIYERLIGATIIQDRVVPNRRDRADFFHAAAAPEHAGKDVFLDPDTGFRIHTAPPARRRYDEYLFAREVSSELLPPESTRVAIIYDQSISRGSELESATLKLRGLRNLGLHAFAYCAQCAMLGISRSEARVREITASVRERDYFPQDRFQATHEMKEVAE